MTSLITLVSSSDPTPKNLQRVGSGDETNTRYSSDTTYVYLAVQYEIVCVCAATHDQLVRGDGRELNVLLVAPQYKCPFLQKYEKGRGDIFGEVLGNLRYNAQ